MKLRTLSILLALIFLLCEAAPSVAAAEVPGQADELARSAQLGFDTTLAGAGNISAEDYLSLLDHFVAIAAPEQAKVWAPLFSAARQSDEPLSRADGFTLLGCAAELVGGDYLGLQQEDTLWELNEIINEPWDHIFGAVSYDILDGEYLGAPSTLTPQAAEWNQDKISAAYFYAMGRYSAYSGKMIFAYNPVTNSMDPASPLTRTDALLAVTRLFDSAGYAPSDRLLTVEDHAILAAAEERKAAILGSDSDYTVGEGGTIYYVSPNGDDANDGLSPETAWKTLDKVNSAALSSADQWNNDHFPEYLWVSEHPDQQISLKSGDVVLFERDSLWRGVLRTVPGITYSAYGKGEKPEIWGSPENGSGSEKWSLVEGTNNIWKFYRILQDCGGIYLATDGEETVAIKKAGFWMDEWNGKENIYLDLGQGQQFTDMTEEEWLSAEELDVTNLDDLYFFNDIRYATDIQNRPLEFGAWGNLYLRCDAGNPGEVYEDIEFFTGNNAWNQNIVRLTDGVTLDNLSFRYGSAGIGMAEATGATVQNCCVSWCGGIMLQYDINVDGATFSRTGLSAMRTGDGIMSGGNHNQVLNNYITQTFDFGITVEEFAGDWTDGTASVPRDHITISGNLMESCSGGLIVVDWFAWEYGMDAPVFTNISLVDNMVLNSRNTWAHQEEFIHDGTSMLSPLVLFITSGCENILIENNVFYRGWDQSQTVMFNYDSDTEHEITLRGNTYVQENLRVVLQKERRTALSSGQFSNSVERFYQNFDVQITLPAALGDETAKVLPPSMQLPVPTGWVAFQTDAVLQSALKDGATLRLAQYAENDQFLSLSPAVAAAGCVLAEPHPDAETIRLFCIAEGWLPAADCKSASIR